MSNRTLIFMTSLVVIGMAILLGLNIVSTLVPPKTERYIAYNDVKGMAIEHKHIPYTLNFDQQNKVIDYLNMSVPVGPHPVQSFPEPLNFEKITIYRFNGPDLVLTPIGYLDNDLIFSIPEWIQNAPMKDMSSGKFKALLATTFDP